MVLVSPRTHEHSDVYHVKIKRMTEGKNKAVRWLLVHLKTLLVLQANIVAKTPRNNVGDQYTLKSKNHVRRSNKDC